MTRAAFVIIVLLCTLGLLNAQSESGPGAEGSSTESIKGTVKLSDGTNGVGVSVTAEGTPFTGVTDENGEYLLKGLPVGSYILSFSLDGFTQQEIPISLEAGKDNVLDVTLESEREKVEVTVRPDTPELMNGTENIGVVEVKPSQLATLPALGERDVLRAMQLMPSVSATNESTSGLFVRGGTPDQNLVLLDGMTLYEVDHFFGVFSHFNPTALENIRLYKGGFESLYGGRLSSVIDMTGRSGRDGEFAFGGGISFLSANGYIDMPLGQKGSFMFAGRRSFPNPLSNQIRDHYTAPTTSAGGRGFLAFSEDPSSYFYDLNARGAYELSSKDTVVLSFFHGKDYLDSSRDVSFNLPTIGTDDQIESLDLVEGRISNLSDWENSGVSANWMRTWNDSFFSRLTVAHSRHRRNYDRTTDLKTIVDEEENLLIEDEESLRVRLAAGSSERNDLKDYSVRFETAFSVNNQHTLGFGAEAVRNDVAYHFNFRDDISMFDSANRGTQFAFFVQDTWSILPRLQITPGVRATYFDLTKKTYLDPRLSVLFHVSDRFRLKTAGGKYHQFANRLIREDPLQGDQSFWMLSDADLIPVGSATHVIGGVSYETEGYLFDIQGYRRDLKGISEFATLRQGSGDSQDVDLAERFYSGTGRAEGVEFLAQKKFGRNVGWLSYTLGKVDYLFPEIGPNPFPASHDSTHEFKIVDSFRWRSFTFSGNWVYATGKPFTQPMGVEEIALPTGNRTLQIVELGDKNDARLPSYHRLDVSANWRFFTGETTRANAGVTVFNAYDRKNVWRKEYDVINEEIIETDINYLGVTLSAYLNVDFLVPSLSRKKDPSWLGPGGKSSRKKGKKAKIYDFHGTLVSMDSRSLVVDSEWGTQTFLMDDSSIKGASDYEPGTPLHIYYKEEGDENLVTMVVRKSG